MRSSAVILSDVPVASTVSDSGETSTTLARNSWTVSSTWLRVGAHLHQQQLALHRLRRLELDDLDDVHELVELLGHLLEREVLDGDDDRHPRDARLLGGAHRERGDVEPAAGEQPRDAGEHAGLVLDEHRERVLLHHASCSWDCSLAAAVTSASVSTSAFS